MFHIDTTVLLSILWYFIKNLSKLSMFQYCSQLQKQGGEKAQDQSNSGMVEIFGAPSTAIFLDLGASSGCFWSSKMAKNRSKYFVALSALRNSSIIPISALHFDLCSNQIKPVFEIFSEIFRKCGALRKEQNVTNFVANDDVAPMQLQFGLSGQNCLKWD